MSTYAQFNEDGNQYQIASNLGWSEFGDWVEELDEEKYAPLVSLFEHGVSQDIPALTTALTDALENEKPGEDVAGTADLLLDALHANQDAEFVLTTG